MWDEQAKAAGGLRSTRAQVLKSLALKEKFNKQPLMFKNTKVTRESADYMSLDPTVNDNHQYNSSIGFFKPKARIRNHRGQFESIDFHNHKLQFSHLNESSQGIAFADQKSAGVSPERDNKLRKIEK